MPLEDHVYPQSSDPNDGQNFAQLIGQYNQIDYVEAGLHITNLDTEAGTITVTDGLCYIGITQDTSPSTGGYRERLGYAVQLGERTVDLATTDGKNYVYVDGNIDTRNSPQIIVSDSDDQDADDVLLIGTVEPSGEPIKELNREPSAVFQDLEIKDGILLSTVHATDELTTDGDIVAGDETIWDSSDGHIPQSNLENDTINVVAGNHLAGGGNVELGDTIILGVQGDDFVNTNGDTVTGNIDVDGEISTTSFISESTQTDSLDVTSTANVGSDLHVDGEITESGDQLATRSWVMSDVMYDDQDAIDAIEGEDSIDLSNIDLGQDGGISSADGSVLEVGSNSAVLGGDLESIEFDTTSGVDFASETTHQNGAEINGSVTGDITSRPNGITQIDGNIYVGQDAPEMPEENDIWIIPNGGSELQ